MLLKDLEIIGLREKEAQVYLAALELGETNINRLAEKSKIKRTTVYLAVDLLKQRGLISEVKKNKKNLFLAEDPLILQSAIEERKTLLSKIMPELLSFDNLLDKKPGVRYFEGEEGIKAIFNEAIKKPNQELKIMFSENYLTDFDKTFFNQYTPLRISRRVSIRAIVSNVPAMQEYIDSDRQSLRHTKVLPANPYNPRIEIIVFQNFKIGLIAFKEKFGLVIESELINKSFASIFETLWMFASEPARK